MLPRNQAKKVLERRAEKTTKGEQKQVCKAQAQEPDPAQPAPTRGETPRDATPPPSPEPAGPASSQVTGGRAPTDRQQAGGEDPTSRAHPAPGTPTALEEQRADAPVKYPAPRPGRGT